MRDEYLEYLGLWLGRTLGLVALTALFGYILGGLL